MAQVQATRRDDAAAEAIPIGNIVNTTAALLSLGLVVGVGVWSYRMLARDVSEVPVIKAVVGEMRVRPEMPGGVPAPNQGLAVNYVAADGSAAPLPDRVVLAPRPASLDEEDMPMGELTARRVAEAAAAAKADEPAPEPAVMRTEEPSRPKVSIETLAVQLALGVIPAAALDAEGGARIEKASLSSDDTPSAPRGPKIGLARSLRPHLRPQVLDRAATFSPTQAAQTTVLASLDVDPSTLEPGARLAQLGAFDSADAAREEWARLDSLFGDYMEGKSRLIQEAASGGRTFFRLRAVGFDDLSDARRFCAAFVAQKTECIPVVAK